jgi:hypothetical protein
LTFIPPIKVRIQTRSTAKRRWVDTSNTRDSFLAGQIGNVDERVVEGSVNVGDTEDVLAISNLGAEGNGGFFLWGLGLFWCLEKWTVQNNPQRLTLEDTVAHVVEAQRTIFNGWI